MLVKNENAVVGVAVKPATKRNTQPAERVRLAEDTRGEQRWKLWGSYLSERQWGTVREDYSAHVPRGRPPQIRKQATRNKVDASTA